MKMKLNRPIKDQKGQVFIVVIILMLVASLLITPLLTYMYSGRIATFRNEVRMNELYAADAGVEDAIQKIKAKKISIQGDLPNSPNMTRTYNMSATRGLINGKTVNPVAITYVDNITFKIQSRASGGNSVTTIVSYINIANFYSNLLKNAITSPNLVNCQPGVEVNGTVQVPASGDETGGAVQPPYTVDHNPPTWPPYKGLSEFYLSQVPDSAPHYYSTLTINLADGTNTDIGPLYVDGDLNINGPNGAQQSANVTLGGTVYVTGGVTFSNTNITLILGNPASEQSHTIYAEGQGYPTEGQPPSIDIPSSKITIIGPGCVISEKAINFQPNITTGAGFIFVLSTTGEVNFQPSGSFTGSVAGDVQVNVQPGFTFQWVEPPDYLNVPPGSGLQPNVIQQILTWDIRLSESPTLVILTTLLPSGEVGIPYSEELAASGGVTPYTWTSGALPPGLTLSGDTISGTPAGPPGTSSFTVQVTDAVGTTAQKTVSITINAAPIITTTTLPEGTEGVPYSQALAVSGGTAPFTWSYSGSLPDGLTLSGDTISGTPTAVGTFSFTVQVEDAMGAIDTQDLSITIYAAVTIVTPSLPDGRVDVPYSQTLTATGGTTPYTWTIVAGSLPTNLTLDPTTGIISGTPVLADKNKTFNFTVRVTESGGGTATKDFSIKIKP